MRLEPQVHFGVGHGWTCLRSKPKPNMCDTNLAAMKCVSLDMAGVVRCARTSASRRTRGWKTRSRHSAREQDFSRRLKPRQHSGMGEVSLRRGDRLREVVPRLTCMSMLPLRRCVAKEHLPLYERPNDRPPALRPAVEQRWRVSVRKTSILTASLSPIRGAQTASPSGSELTFVIGAARSGCCANMGKHGEPRRSWTRSAQHPPIITALSRRTLDYIPVSLHILRHNNPAARPHRYRPA